MATTTQSVRKAIQKNISTVQVFAYLNSNQTGLLGTTWNKISMDKILYDAGKNYDTSNHKFIAPVTGFYHIRGVVHFTTITNTKRYMAALYKNGVAMKYGYQHAALVADLSVAVEADVFLQQNDYIELYAQPEVGGGVNTVAAVSGKEYTSLIIRLITKEGVRQ